MKIIIPQQQKTLKKLKKQKITKNHKINKKKLFNKSNRTLSLVNGF